jgi:hypothetical protein
MAGSEPSQGSLLVELAEVELFTTSLGEAYARIPVGGHVETRPIRSKAFRQWLARCYYQCYGRTAHAQAMQDALTTIEGHALFDSYQAEVHVRIGTHENLVYLDLADESWRAVEISRDGWRVVADPTVRFRRTPGMLPLPEPVNGSDLGLFREFVNVEDDDWRLLIGWLVGAVRPRGPYPLLCLHGEQGSAKTTSAAMVCGLIDPRVGRLRAEPRDDRELMVSARSNWVLAFDNVSRLSPWLSDAMCRLATGGGLATRKLYTDAEEMIFEAQRPIILTGIEEVATRGDLLDRAIIASLPRIASYRSEAELWQLYEQLRPAILGALLDAVACALLNEHDVELARVPRMADFAIWVTAAEPALGWAEGSFLVSYEHKRDETHELALEASPIAQAMQDIVEEAEFFGTATHLLERLNLAAGEERVRKPDWPRNGRALSGHLRRIAPNLRQLGIEVEFNQKLGRSRRAIRIGKTPNPASPASQPSQTTRHQVDDRDAATLATEETKRIRRRASAAKNGSFPLPGDDSFPEALLTAHNTDFITTQEALDRKEVHDLVLAWRPPIT